MPLAVATAGIFFVAALAVVPKPAGVLEGCLIGLAICSPSVMLGVERGNVDLFVFAVVVAGVLLLSRYGRTAAVGPALLLVSAVLKLFPILASVSLLRRGRTLRAFGAVVLAFGLYVIATLGTVREIRRVVPQTSTYSYGIKPFAEWAHDLSATYGLHLSAFAWRCLFVAVALVAAPFVSQRLRRSLETDPGDPVSVRSGDLFVAGAATYVGSFVLFQSFEYRLVFLLLTIPQLFRWAREGRLPGAAALVLVVLTLWLGAPWNGVPVVDPILDGWSWLTSRRPFFAAGMPLTAAESSQLALATLLLPLLVAMLPRIRVPQLRRV